MPTTGSNTKTVVIDFKVLPGDAVKTIQDTQKKIENLKSTMAGMKAAGLENSETYMKLSAAMKDLQQVVRANQKVLLDSIKEQNAEGDSLNAMSAQLRGLREEYENLSKSERDSDIGANLLENIKSTTDEVTSLEHELGDFTRNVGNYWSALEGFPGGKLILMMESLGAGTMSLSQVFKTAGQSVKAFSKQLFALMANPVVAAIAAISAAVMKLVSAFKMNDQAMTALESAFASFKPVTDVINKAFQALTGVVTKVVEGIGKGVRALMSWIPGFKKYVDAEEDVVRASDNLEDAEREFAINSAKRQAKISELRAKSTESDKYSFKERKKFLQRALDLEKEELEEKKSIAEEKLSIAETSAANEMGYAEMTEEVYEMMSDEMKNHITELRVAVINADKEYSDGTRRIRSQMSNFVNQEKQEQEERAKAAASARKERLENERAAVDALQKMWVDGIRDLQDKEYALTAQAGRKQIDDLKKRLKEEKNLTKTAKEAINRQIILLEADLQLELGDLRKKYQQDELEKQLNDKKEYYQKVLEGLEGENVDGQVAVNLVINDIDTDMLKRSSEIALDKVKNVWESAQKELEDFESGNISVDEITTKYKDVWELNGINLGNALANMKALVFKYQKDVEAEEVRHANYLIAVGKASEKEQLRIKLEGTKKTHDAETKRLDLSKKNAEILRQIELASNFDEYGRNEVEKTKIMLGQAKERERIAREEYERIASERQRYTDEELTAIYGSVEEYNNKVLEANLKLVESENDVKQAVKDVADATNHQKQIMIDTAMNTLSAFNQLVNSFSELFSTLAENDEKYQKYANALAFVDIMNNMAVGIATAVAKGMEMGWPAAAVMIPVGIATVVSGIAQAIALYNKNSKIANAPEFATGGLIGNKTTRRKDDTVDAKLTLGEYVIPAPVVDDLGVEFFDRLIGKNGMKPIGPVMKFANGGLVPNINNITANAVIDYDMMRDIMKESMTEAISEMPNPVVSVKEITYAQNRVSTKERIARQ